MQHTFRLILLVCLLGIMPVSLAQEGVDLDIDIDYDDDHEYEWDNDLSDEDELKISAIEALMSAPPRRALPIVTRVLRGDDHPEVKEAALFVLSQIHLPEAHALLVETARNGSGDVQEEAIRMIGISGDEQSLAGLMEIYRNGNEDIREAVIEAYLIADDAESIFKIAEAATDPDEFEEAVETLGAMGEMEYLRRLRNKVGMSEELIEAYAIAGDVESLRELALDTSDPRRQAEAIEGLAITGHEESKPMFVEIYRTATNSRVKEAALDAMHIAGYEEGVLELFRTTDNPKDKRELLETLVHMDSDAVWDIIDKTLEDR